MDPADNEENRSSFRVISLIYETFVIAKNGS